MRAPEWRGAIRTTFNRVNDGGQPVRHIQRGRFPRQQVIAQGAQHHRQVADKGLSGRVLLARAVAPRHRDQGVGGGAVGVEVVEGRAGRGRVGRIGHGGVQSGGQGGLSEQGSILLGSCSLFL